MAKRGSRNSVNTGAKGMVKSPKAGVGKCAINQKLGTGTLGGATGVNVKSFLEPAAAIKYSGHDQGAGVKHGAHGLLAGKGGGGKGKLGAKKGANYL